MNLKEICTGVEKTALRAGRYIKNEAGRFDKVNAEQKGLHDYVTHVDKATEKMIVEELGKLLPEAGFLTEENTISKKGEKYNWVIDPLDGTTNFIHNIHPFAISIGLMINDEVVAGVVHEASGSETFTAWKGGGAWLNGRRISVSNTSMPGNCLIATGFPYKDFSRLDQYISCLEWFLKNSSGVRRMGSAAIDLANVACGRYDLFFEYGINPWDVSAGMLLVREAGGVVSDFSGSFENITGEEIIASNKPVFKELLEIISTFMAK